MEVDSSVKTAEDAACRRAQVHSSHNTWSIEDLIDGEHLRSCDMHNDVVNAAVL